jgi:uncharacterized FlaG/YvyC family protein
MVTKEMTTSGEEVVMIPSKEAMKTTESMVEVETILFMETMAKT